MPRTWIGSAVTSASSKEFIARTLCRARDPSSLLHRASVSQNPQFDLRTHVGRDEARRTAVALDDFGHDRQSQSGTAGVARARRVRTNEALEEPTALADVDAVAVVGHRDHGLGPFVVRVEPQLFGGVARRVVEI